MENEAPTYKIIYLETGKESLTSRDFTGLGKAFYPNGDVYEGEYVGGLRQGKGKYTYKNGFSYTGDYVLNKKTGKGVFDFKKKGEYEGEFKDNLRSGLGTFKYPNGDVYTGEWVNGKKEGYGTYEFAKGAEKLIGNWKKGNFFHGRWILNSGMNYMGGFKNKFPHGKGTWTNKNGNFTYGKYDQVFLEEEAKEEEKVVLDYDKLEAEGNYIKKNAEEDANPEKKENDEEPEKEEDEDEPVPEPEPAQTDAEPVLGEDGNPIPVEPKVDENKEKEEEDKENEGKKRVFVWKYRLGIFDHASQVKEIQL